MINKSHSLLFVAIVSLMASISVRADVIISSAITTLPNDATPQQKQEAAAFIQEQVSSHWKEMSAGLIEVQTEKVRLETLPEKAFFSDTKQDARNNIEKLYSRLFNDILDKDINKYRDELAETNKRIKKNASDISTLKAEKSFVFTEEEINELNDQINELTQVLHKAERQRDELINKFAERLAVHNVHLTPQQIESLLGRVNGDDLIAAVTIFPLIKGMVVQLGEASKSASENLNTAKRYYGLYSELLALQLFIYDQFDDRLSNEYIPKLEAIRTESEQLVRDTQKNIASADRDTKPIFQANLKSQALNLKAIDLYSKVLNKDKARFEKVKKIVQKRKLAADNTLATVSHSLDIASLIKTSATMFDSVSELTTPDIIVFDNTMLEQQFNDLTERLNEG